MKELPNLATIRREYGNLDLHEEAVANCPITQFKQWFQEVLQVEKNDPTAMVLSTVDAKGYPDSRVVLLKDIKNEAFIFYTNYQSAKALQLREHPQAALNFYWPQMGRQVRVRGVVKCISKASSDAYFASRPMTSQVAAIVSPQSKKIDDRQSLLQTYTQLFTDHANSPIKRPAYWGGYQLKAKEIEFWQGRDNRLHDRICYYKKRDRWIHVRLAP